jgi:hypothetical protein
MKDENPSSSEKIYAKSKILKNMLLILMEEYKKGHDVEVLLSDGFPMILELYGAQNRLKREERVIIINTNNPNDPNNNNNNNLQTVSSHKDTTTTTESNQIQIKSNEEKRYTPTLNEIIQTFKHVVAKFETNGDYGLLMMLKWALDYSLSQFQFLTQTQASLFTLFCFRYHNSIPIFHCYLQYLFIQILTSHLSFLLDNATVSCFDI